MRSPTSNEVTEFLLSRQHSASGSEIDWDARLREWLDAVERLYQKVKELLAESRGNGLVTISQVDKELQEEYLGTYKVPELVLNLGEETVRFSPKGRNVVGAKGRVDLIGELDTVTLVLEPEGHWSVVLSRVPRDVVGLDDKTLAQALRRVMR